MADNAEAATCGSAEDHYYYSPWRAPGSAPVFDACGMAGGSPWAIGAPGWAPGGAASAGVRYQNTAPAKPGARGGEGRRQFESASADERMRRVGHGG